MRAERFLTVKEMSEILNIPQSTIYELIKNGDIPYIRLSQRTIRIPKSFIDMVLENIGKKGEKLGE